MEIINPQNEWWEKNVKSRYNEFVSWLGNNQNSTRLWIKDFIINNGVKSILDTACGPCIDYEVLKPTCIKYSGIDSTSVLVDMAKLRGIDVSHGNIEELPFNDNSFDMVYGRHILEHLEYYEKAIKESVRCSKKYVAYTFFLEHKDEDIFRVNEGAYANSYNLNKMRDFIQSLGCMPLMVKYPVFGNQSIIIIEKHSVMDVKFVEGGNHGNK
ncbi:MAG: class I SAM-dependent methyltransferase [Nitrospirae bacterium]|nr:class I SAM-dependent methyltransferase [Nitrospirota bacterium]